MTDQETAADQRRQIDKIVTDLADALDATQYLKPAHTFPQARKAPQTMRPTHEQGSDQEK